METNFMVTIDEIGQLTSIRRLGIPNRVEYRNSGFKSSSAMIWLHCVKIR